MGQPSSKEVRGSRSEGRTPARVPDGDEKASDNTPSNEAAKEKGKQTQLEDDAVPGSSSEERNQRHNQFMDDVDRLIDKEIQPSVEDIIKKPEYNDKDISSADINGTYADFILDVQEEKERMMKEKRYEHWQTLVWNDYQTALTFSVFRPPGITLKAQTLQDTIKPECKRQILLYNESSTYGARGSYYTQHGWSRSEGGLGQSSEDERNQRDKEQFEDDVNSLIDNKIQPLVLESIKAQGYQDKHISRSADGMLHSPFFGDVQKKMQGIMEEKKYGHWQRLVWNRYHSALTFSAFREGITLNAQTLQDTIKPECLRLISETNEAPLGVRAYYYKQHGWSGGGFNSVAYQPSSSLLEHHATATVPTSHAALSNMHFEAMAVMQIMTTAFIAGLALGWCLRRRCDHRNQASSGAPELPKYGATAEGHCMEEC